MVGSPRSVVATWGVVGGDSSPWYGAYGARITALPSSLLFGDFAPYSETSRKK